MKGLSRLAGDYGRRVREKSTLIFIALCAMVAVAVTRIWLTLNSTSSNSENRGAEDNSSSSNSRKLRPGMEGQATLEWVLIGGILVVIIVAVLTTVFKPQLEAIMTNILKAVQQNTGG